MWEGGGEKLNLSASPPLRLCASVPAGAPSGSGRLPRAGRSGMSTHHHRHASHQGSSDKPKVEDSKQLLRQMGVKRAALQLESLKKELRSLCDPLFDPSNAHKVTSLRRSTAEVLGESARVRYAARSSVDARMKKYARKCQRDMQDGVEADIKRISSFNEEVGSPRTKTYLTKMRQHIHERRMRLMVEEQRLNEGTIHQAIQHERALVAAARAKRIAARKEQLRWSRRKSAAAKAASAKRHRLRREGGQDRASAFSSSSSSSSSESEYEPREDEEDEIAAAPDLPEEEEVEGVDGAQQLEMGST